MPVAYLQPAVVPGSKDNVPLRGHHRPAVPPCFESPEPSALMPLHAMANTPYANTDRAPLPSKGSGLVTRRSAPVPPNLLQSLLQGNVPPASRRPMHCAGNDRPRNGPDPEPGRLRDSRASSRSEEHTSELQSRENLVCRLLL